MTAENSYHYIIIGAGASGCALANRLSEAPDVQVLLLEAGGPDDSSNIHDIGGFVRLWGSEADWKLTTEKQSGMNDREILINQGKVLGGSTSINALMYVRGNPRDFDRWNEQTGGGWSYREVLPYFRKSEDFEGGASEYHGVGGPLSVRYNPDAASRSELYMQAAKEVGYEGPFWDYNGERQEHGAGLLQFTITKDGLRCSAATAFLAPALSRPNLTVKTGSRVLRIGFEGIRAVSVEYVENGVSTTARIEREVVVTAGALITPQILMLSGIGSAEHLHTHGIEVLVDQPEVGQNLQDHVQLPVVYRAKHDLPNPTLLTGNVVFIKTRSDTASVTPDLQLNFTPAVPLPLVPILDFGGPAGIFLPIMVQPRSIGEVRLRSSNPLDQPLIDPRYLQDPADVQTFVEAIRIIREIANTRAFSELYSEELVPGKHGDIEAHIRNLSSTLWHPAGTCRMGSDAGAVVDPQLRVNGVEGVRVADASVMPIVTSGNTLAACYMIAEKAADLILYDAGKYMNPAGVRAGAASSTTVSGNRSRTPVPGSPD